MTSSYTPVTPPSLLHRLTRCADADAWGRFVGLYAPVLLAWSRRLGLQADEAADLTQDVFVRLLEALPAFRYDPSQRFRAWLWTVLLNCHRKRLRGRPLPAALDATDPAAPDGLADWVEAEYRQHLIGRAVRLMRSDFEETTWRACWALVVEGRPAAEVAAELGLTPAAVYKARVRVLLRLRQELDGLLD